MNVSVRAIAIVLTLLPGAAFAQTGDPIHLLAVYTLVMLPVGVIAARRHVTERHRRTMVGIFVGGLVIAGLFTFYPGRIMYHVVFGP